MKHLIPVLVAITLTLFGGALVAVAAETAGQYYTPLAPLPGTFDPATNKTDLSTYLAGMMKLAVAVAGALAVLMLIIGGTQYVAAGITPDGKSNAKEHITNAAIGLALTLASYLILFSINPKLVDFNLALPPIALKSEALVPSIATYSTRGDVGCTTCVSIESEIPYKPGACDATQCTISSLIIPKLTALTRDLKAAGVGWQISEAWPPTRKNHIAKCQNPNNPETGTCIDASLSHKERTPAKINTFIASAKKSGMRPVYEVTSEARERELINGGVPAASVKFVAGITGEHFSVYNN